MKENMSYLSDEKACKQFEYFPSQKLDLGLLANHLYCRASKVPESLYDKEEGMNR